MVRLRGDATDAVGALRFLFKTTGSDETVAQSKSLCPSSRTDDGQLCARINAFLLAIRRLRHFIKNGHFPVVKLL
jgi:hypothetical protein